MFTLLYYLYRKKYLGMTK